MDIVAEKTGEPLILRLKGRLDAASVAGFDKEVDKWLGQGAKRVIVDLAALEYISSAGLRSFLSAGKKIKNLQGRMVFCGLNSVVREVFEMSGLDTLFTICGSFDDAAQQVNG
jgi:anti-sigma B factor antagonist